jgi:hypothetical protein
MEMWRLKNRSVNQKRLRTDLRRGGGKSAPAPDYAGAAREQGDASAKNIASQTWANRPTINTPWGQQSWTTGTKIDPATGQTVTDWTSNITLSPEQQAALDAQMKIQQGRSEAAGTLLGQATEAFQKPFDWGGMPERADLASVGYDPTGARDRAEQALYQRQMNLMEPGQTRAEDARRARMAAMGIPLEGGSAAFERAQEGMARDRQRMQENAALSAIAGGGAEAGRELGLATGAAGFQNTLRQQAIAEEAQRRGMTLNELNALLTGQQVNMPNMSQNAPGSTAGAAQSGDMLSAAGMQGNWDQANRTDWGQLAGTAAMGAMMFSDRRLKKDVVSLGDGWYEYTYIWGGPRRVGVMADELALTRPDLVHVHESGYLMVDYGGL